MIDSLIPLYLLLLIIALAAWFWLTGSPTGWSPVRQGLVRQGLVLPLTNLMGRTRAWLCRRLGCGPEAHKGLDPTKSEEG